MATKITPSMERYLRLAAMDEIRYYKGGFYSIPFHLGQDQRHHHAAGAEALTSAPPQTLRALVSRGLLDVSAAPDIYARRWTITAAGRAALEG